MLPTPSPIRQNPIRGPRTGETPEPVIKRPPAPPGIRQAIPATFKKGGRVRRTGMAKVHKGETVMPAAAGALGKGVAKRAKKLAKQVKKAAKGKK